MPDETLDRKPPESKPPVIMDPTVLRLLLDLVDTAQRQRTAIALLEERLGSVEGGLHLVEAELERQVCGE